MQPTRQKGTSRRPDGTYRLNANQPQGELNRVRTSMNQTPNQRRLPNERGGTRSRGHTQRRDSNHLSRDSHSARNQRQLYDDAFLLYADARGHIGDAPRDYEGRQPTRRNPSNQNSATRTGGSSRQQTRDSQAVHNEAHRNQHPSDKQSGGTKTDNVSYDRMAHGQSTSRRVQRTGDEILIPREHETDRNKYYFFYGDVEHYVPWCATCDRRFETPVALREHLATKSHIKRSLEYRIEHLKAMCQESEHKNVIPTEKQSQIRKQRKDVQGAITQALHSGSKMHSAVIRDAQSSETSTTYTDELLITNVDTRKTEGDNKAVLSANDRVRQKADTGSVPDLITFGSDEEKTESGYCFAGATGLHGDGREVQKEPHAIDILLAMEADIPCQCNSTTGDNNNKMNTGCNTSLCPIYRLGSSNDNENTIRCNDNAVESEDDIPSEEGLLIFDSDEDKYPLEREEEKQESSGFGRQPGLCERLKATEPPVGPQEKLRERRRSLNQRSAPESGPHNRHAGAYKVKTGGTDDEYIKFPFDYGDMHGYVPYCYTCQRRFPNTHLLKCHLRSNEHVTNAQNYCALHSQGTNPDKRQPKMANLTDGQSNSLKGNSKQPKADRLHGKKGESVGVAKGTVLPMNTSEAATDQVRQSKSFKGNWKQRKAASLHGKKRISVGVTKGTASCVSLSEAANDQVRQSKSLKGNWKQRKAASLRGKKRRSIGVTKSAAPRVSLSEAANDQVGQSKNLKDNSKQPKMAPLHFIKSGGIKTIPRVGSSEAANDQDRKLNANQPQGELNRVRTSMNQRPNQQRLHNERGGTRSGGHTQRRDSNYLSRDSHSARNQRQLYDDAFLLYADARGHIGDAPRDYEGRQPTRRNPSNQNSATRTGGSSRQQTRDSQAVHNEAHRNQHPSDKQSGGTKTDNVSYDRMAHGQSTSRRVQRTGDEILIPREHETDRNKYYFFYGDVEHYVPWCATCDRRFETPVALREHLATKSHIKRSLEYRIEHLKAMCQESEHKNVIPTEKQSQIRKQRKGAFEHFILGAITQALHSGSKMHSDVIRDAQSSETSTTYTDELLITNVGTRKTEGDNVGVIHHFNMLYPILLVEQKAVLSANDRVRQKADTGSVPDLITFGSDEEKTESGYCFAGATGLHGDGREVQVGNEVDAVSTILDLLQKEPHAIDILLAMEADIPCQCNSTTGDNNNEMNTGCNTSLCPIYRLGSSNDNENTIRCNDNAAESEDDVPSEEGLLIFDSDEDNYSSTST
ncbi:hypothetical protein M514_08932 [Trichuris suis]|uniref:C2H2-type domain-containing protein n=1 Tax=Trichuris suis TaxID=68888 RepID=A0A085NLR5_9BILA|nr:hypothetical protein M514_08932 [Trichuris suis]